MNRSRAILLAAMIISIGVPLPAAFAHAEVVSWSPAEGARLSALPKEVKIEFEENLLTLGDAKTNVLDVKDSKGAPIDNADSKVSGRFLSVTLGKTTLTGIFTVSWRVVSGDGHPVIGSYKFSVGSTTEATPIATSSSSPTFSPTASAIEKSSAVKRANFWNQYQSRILLAGLFLVAIILWLRFKRVEKGIKIEEDSIES